MKTLQIFLKKSKATVLFSAVILLSAFLISATVAPSMTAVDRLIVYEPDCTGCGLCEAIAPNCLIVVDGKANVLVGWESYEEDYWLAIESCPMGAISLQNY